jgi:hypothetical protein
MSRTLGVLAALVVTLILPIGAEAEDPSTAEFLKSALGREFLGADRAQTEVLDFVEVRFPVMPEIISWDDWRRRADRMRAEVLERVIFRGEAASWRDAQTRVEWLETMEGGPGYRIKTLRYEALPGLWIPALLYEPEPLEGHVPVILNVNGHDPNGKAADYKQTRCINQAKRGMIALNVEWFGMGQLRAPGFDHGLINAIDLCGTSGIATHYLAMTRGLDVLLAHEHADPNRVAVTGLSGGGWQTIFVSAFDTRVQLSVPVAGYSSFFTKMRHFDDLGDSEQTPCDLATVTDYALMTAMLAPRSALLIFNARDDCCFAAPHALPLLWRTAAPIFRLAGKEGLLRAHVNFDPGNHNYGRDNRRALYTMLGDRFYPGDPAYDAEEIECQSELKTKDQLQVELPPDNADFAAIALALSQNLPRDGDFPSDRGAAQRWQTERRERLRAIVKARTWDVKARPVGSGPKSHHLQAQFWKLQVGKDWTVPVVEIVPEDARGTVILVADEGRKQVAAEAEQALTDHRRVLAVDPLGLGESKLPTKEGLFDLLICAVGERPLGIQASQLAAIARWARQREREPVTLAAIGSRASVAALVAAAVEERAIGQVRLRGSLGSLKELIEQKKKYPDAPELFCFGLLEALDIKQLVALVAPRPVSFEEPSDRAKAELGAAKSWYKVLGSEFDPLP